MIFRNTCQINDSSDIFEISDKDILKNCEAYKYVFNIMSMSDLTEISSIIEQTKIDPMLIEIVCVNAKMSKIVKGK